MLSFETKAYSEHGADLGRRSIPHLSGRVHLRRVRLDRGGYDRGGAYWGLGEPLWCAWDADGAIRYLRAPSRDAAKSILSAGPNPIRFYR